jgi:hypothetical protein
VLESAGQAASLILSLPFSNYTGVLIGATAIPVWNENAGSRPLHFGASAVSAAVGLLELMGHQKIRALQALGLGAAIMGCWESWRIESRQQSGLDPLQHGPSGALVRVGGALSGPVPAVLRAISMAAGKDRLRSLRRWAGISALAGSLLTCIAWIHAGHVSARDWREALGISHPIASNVTQAANAHLHRIYGRFEHGIMMSFAPWVKLRSTNFAWLDACRGSALKLLLRY